MPYSIVKVEGKFRLKNKDTGKLLPGGSDSKEEAEARRRAIMAKENQSVQLAFEPFAFENGQPIRILPEGTWYRGDRKLHITKQLLEEVQNNFELGLPQYRVGFNLDHAEDRGKVGDIHKLVYLDNLPAGPGLYATEYDFLPKGLKAIDEDGYDGVSAEIVWSMNDGAKFQDPETGEEYDNVLVGVALTPQPFFGHGQVALYSATPTSRKENAIEEVWKSFKESLSEAIFGKEDIIENEVVEDLEIQDIDGGDDMSQEVETLDVESLEEEALEDKEAIEELKAQIAGLEEQLAEKDEIPADEFVSKKDYEALSAKHETLEAEVKSERLSAEVMAFKALSLDKDEYIEKMSALEDKEPELAEWVREKLAGVDKSLAEAGLFEEIGSSEEDTANSLEALTEQKIKSEFGGDPSKYAEAMQLVVKEHPELYSPFVAPVEKK